MRNIILSVKPIYSKKILSSEKKIELRKSVGKNFVRGSRVFVYETSPTKMLVGVCVIDKIEKIRVHEIKIEELALACVEYYFYEDYFANKEYAYLIYLTKAQYLATPFSLDTLRKTGFTAPQSFCYASDQLLKLLGEL